MNLMIQLTLICQGLRHKVGLDVQGQKESVRKLINSTGRLYVARNATLKVKNKLLEKMVQMMERDETYRVEHVVKILNELPGVMKWSSFHVAALKHLIANVANRQGFMAFSSVDDKIRFLERRTGIKLSGGL